MALYLSFETDLNDKLIWRAIEDAALENLHLFDLKNSCKLHWALTSQKPKMTSARLDNLLSKMALDRIESGIESADDFHHIFQGHRNKKQIDIYLKLKKDLIEKKQFLNPTPKEGGDMVKWANNLTNLFYSLASNRPKKFGVYSVYAAEEIDELLSHYEHDMCEATQFLDSEGLTRLA